MTLIRLNEDSAEAFWRLRYLLFEELGELSAQTNVARLEAATKNYYRSHINRDLFCWAVTQQKEIIATGALCLFNRIPYQGNLSGREGYILSIYTCPAFRRQGCATQILKKMIQFASENQIERLWLDSSQNGKQLYLQHSFIEKKNVFELFL